MKSTNEILKRIREVCGLEKLEFGCEYKDIHGNTRIFINNFGKEKHRCLNNSGDFGDNLNIFIKEIIGLPVELNHLIKTIPGVFQFIEGKMLISPDFGQAGYSGDYKLDLTVEQNLNQNEELRAFISELIFK